MLSKELEAKIILLFKNEKWPQSTIAKELGIHKSAVKRVLQNNPETTKIITRERMIDPYIPFIKNKLKEYPTLKAPRLFQMVVELGYPGKIDYFRELIVPLRPEKTYEAFTKLTVLEGEQAQVDWACFGSIKVGNIARKLYAFLMVLSWSRQIFLKYYFSMETSLFLQGHIEAFNFFKGVTREIWHDNLKSAVLQRYEKLVQFNEIYLKFATHYRFIPKACNVRRGNEKGRVERAVRYVRDNFFAGREFSSIDDLNKQALEWCRGISGTRRCVAEPLLTVSEAFAREQTKLLPLPNDNYPIYTRELAKVGKTHYAKFDSNEYSVPGEYVRKQVIVQATEDKVEFLYKDSLIASHTRSWSKGECILNPIHRDEILKSKARLFYSQNVENLLTLLPNAKCFLEKIATQGGNLGNAVLNLHNCLNDYGIDFMQEGIEIINSKITVSITDLRIIVEKLRAKKGKPMPLSLSTQVEEKVKQISFIKPNLAKYDDLGR